MSTDIQKYKDAGVPALAADTRSIVEALQENLGNGAISEFDLPRIKVPSAGATFWEVPGLEGKSPEPCVPGVIAFSRDVRVYWEKSLDEGGGSQPPDCSSTDCITGVGKPGGDCAKCPFAQFGSAMKNGVAQAGQACGQYKQLYMLTPYSQLPVLVNVPPSSLKGARKYLIDLAGQGMPQFSVKTGLTLLSKKSTGGQPYSEIQFGFLGRLRPEDLPKAREFNGMMRGLLNLPLPAQYEAAGAPVPVPQTVDAEAEHAG